MTNPSQWELTVDWMACVSARSCSNKVESSAGSPHASDITNFGSARKWRSLYPKYAISRFVISRFYCIWRVWYKAEWECRETWGPRDELVTIHFPQGQCTSVSSRMASASCCLWGERCNTLKAPTHYRACIRNHGVCACITTVCGYDWRHAHAI